MSRGISIHIGMEYFDSEYYNGDDGALSTCGKDCSDMQEIATSQNFEESIVLLNEDATRDAVKSAIISASKSLIEGDMLFISYSGHGTFIEDMGGDEEDGRDEAWCLYNGFLLDDELLQLWTLFKEDVRIFLVSDSCHSGTISKAPMGGNRDDIIVSKLFSAVKAKEVYIQNKEFYDNEKSKASEAKEEDVKARVKLIAGCQDDESSYVLPFADNSLLTTELNAVWSDGEFEGTTDAFFKEIEQRVEVIARKNKIYQMPNLFTIGKENIEFDKQKPFYIG